MADSPAFSLVVDSEHSQPRLDEAYDADDSYLGPVTIHSPRPISNSRTRATIFSSVISLSATTLGAGLLSLPKAFALLGVTWGLIAIISVGILSDLTLTWLVDCSRLSGRRSYEGNAGHYLGRVGAVTLHMFLLLLLAGASVAMLMIAADTAPIESLQLTRTSVLVLFSMISFPLCASSNLSSLKHVSALALGCLAYFYALLISRFAAAKEVADDLNWSEGPSSIQDATLSFSVILSSFICHFNIFKIDTELADMTTTRTTSVIHFSTIGICVTVYVTAGLAGYFIFGPTVSSNVLDDFDDKDFAVIVGKSAICLTNLFKFPLLVVPLRDSVIEAFPEALRHSLNSFLPRVTATFILVASISTAAMNLNDLMHILGLVGCSAGVFTAFFLPAVLRIQFNQKKAEEVNMVNEIRSSSLLPIHATAHTATVKANIFPVLIAGASLLIGLSSFYFSIN